MKKTPSRPSKEELLEKIAKAEKEAALAILAKESKPPKRWKNPRESA